MTTIRLFQAEMCTELDNARELLTLAGMALDSQGKPSFSMLWGGIVCLVLTTRTARRMWRI